MTCTHDNFNGQWCVKCGVGLREILDDKDQQLKVAEAYMNKTSDLVDHMQRIQTILRILVYVSVAINFAFSVYVARH